MASGAGAGRGAAPVDDVDVVVVGAGLSGLVAATRILDGSDDALRVAVVEAAERVGGRNLTVELAGTPFDLGGQWVGPTQTELLSLAEELGVARHKQFCSGTRVMDIGGKVSTYTSEIPTPAGITSLLDLQQLMWRVDAASRRTPAGKPWEAARAAEWDSKTVASVVDAWAFTAAGAALFHAAVRGVFGVESSGLSFLHFLNYVSAAGGFEGLVTIDGGFQDSTFVGGAQTLSVRLAERLEARGAAVHLACPVRRIDHDDGGRVVVACDGRALRARRVVVAMPPSSVERISFTPRLPHARASLNSRAFMGCIIKALVLYDRAFWREKGFSGEVVCDNVSGPAFNVYDDSLPSDARSDGMQPALVVFINARAGSYWHMRPAAERRAAVLRQLATWFGAEAEAPMPGGYVEKDWLSDEWSGGCPIAVWPPGALSEHGPALRAPCGKIHWAGTETAKCCMGFMEGAVRAGQRAAREVVRALASTDEHASGTRSDRPLLTEEESAALAGPDPFVEAQRALQRTRCRLVVGGAALLLLLLLVCVVVAVEQPAVRGALRTYGLPLRDALPEQLASAVDAGVDAVDAAAARLRNMVGAATAHAEAP